MVENMNPHSPSKKRDKKPLNKLPSYHQQKGSEGKNSTSKIDLGILSRKNSQSLSESKSLASLRSEDPHSIS